MNTDVFPPYNLPDEAVPWGREAQKRIIAGENSEVQLSQKVDNGLRATGGQLAVLADQIVSLQGQQDFLLEQVVSQTRNPSPTWVFARDPAEESLTEDVPHDPEVDILISRVAPESGAVRVDMSAVLYAFSSSTTSTFVRAGMYVFPRIQPDLLPGEAFSVGTPLTISALSSGGGGVDENLAGSMFYIVTGLTPGKLYHFYTRRTVTFSTSPGGSTGQQLVRVSSIGMAVTSLAQGNFQN